VSRAALSYFSVQCTFAASGPNVNWDYIGETSASIPCQRKVKDHVERSVNHFSRGKSHTSPGKEEDVTRLQASYRDSRIHQTRKLDSKKKAKDYLARGTQEQVIVRVIGRWSENRVRERSSGDYWEPENAQQTQLFYGLSDKIQVMFTTMTDAAIKQTSAYNNDKDMC
jgi:hypothetical protein